MKTGMFNPGVNQTKISVIVPALNEEKFIEACIRSVQSQDFKDYELIVVDNGSTDKTSEVARKLGATVVYEPRVGLPRARETGRKIANGEILLYIDADTVVPTEFLSKISEFLDKHREVAAVTTPFFFYDGDWKTNVLNKSAFKVFCPLYFMVLDVFHLPKSLLGSTFAVRKHILEKIGGFNTNIKFYGEDTDLSIRISKEGPIAFLPDLYSSTSARRYLSQGLLKTQSIYLFYHFSLILRFYLPVRWFKGPGRKWLPRLAATTCLLGSIGFFAYASTSPKSEIFGKVIYHINTHKKTVALTFDDGPNGKYTQEVIDILDREGIKATFFLIGKNVEAYPDIAKEIAAHGHVIGNHSYTHRWLLPFENEKSILHEVDKAEEAIYNATGESPRIFRPPHGIRSIWLDKVIQKEGYTMFTWDDMTTDYESGTVDRDIAKKILSRVRPGSIIVLHDGIDLKHGVNRENMIEGLILIIKELKKEGYEFVTLNENVKG
ncbi:MAG TPA: polysaccharide deacetylase family protein [Terriglobales bacterium]|nr:polysaccharide deacetylase family protein [Terriglobales bacterium]